MNRDKQRTGNRMSYTRPNPDDDSDTHTSEEKDSDRRRFRSVLFQDDLNRTRTRPRRSDFIKLDRFDGTTSLEAFLAHFDNCARYNGWGYSDKLSQLKASLKGAAAEVLFENERSINLEQLRNELKDNFGNEGFQNEFETQLKTRRRQKGETLRVLYQDVNRLVIQAYPGQSGSIRDKLAIDAFIVSLNDSELELSVRNACTKTLKECFRTALLHESNRSLVRGIETSRDRRRDVRTDVQARVITVGELNNWTKSNNDSDAVINNSQDSMLKRIQDLEQMLKQMQNQNQQNRGHNARGNRYQGNAVTAHPTYPSQNLGGNNWQHSVANNGPSNTQWAVRNQNQFPETMRNTPTQFANVPPQNTRNFNCFTCESPEHISSNCPSRPRFPIGTCYYCGSGTHMRNNCPHLEINRQVNTNYGANVVTVSQSKEIAKHGGDRKAYLDMTLDGVPCQFLLDSGCGMTLLPACLVHPNKILQTSWTAKSVEGKYILLKGEATVELKVGNLSLSTNALVSETISEPILGFDWLVQNEVFWGFGSHQICIRGQTFPLVHKPSGQPNECGGFDLVFPSINPKQTSLNVPTENLIDLTCDDLPNLSLLFSNASNSLNDMSFELLDSFQEFMTSQAYSEEPFVSNVVSPNSDLHEYENSSDQPSAGKLNNSDTATKSISLDWIKYFETVDVSLIDLFEDGLEMCPEGLSTVKTEAKTNENFVGNVSPFES